MSVNEPIPKKNIMYQLPDWFISVSIKYAESINPIDLFTIAAMAYLQGDSEDWFPFVEPVAAEKLGPDPDIDALTTLAVELIEELYINLNTYLKTIIPVEERVIVDVSTINDITFVVTWDEGILQ